MRLLAVACVTVIAFPLRGDDTIKVADRLILDVRVVDPDGQYDSQLNRYGFNGDETGEVTISLDQIAEFTATLDEVPMIASGDGGR
jgi:hypothetical protein